MHGRICTIAIDGERAPIRRPRVRGVDGQEVRFGSYELFHRGEPLTEAVWESPAPRSGDGRGPSAVAAVSIRASVEKV
jgi:hypothetical protein